MEDVTKKAKKTGKNPEKKKSGATQHNAYGADKHRGFQTGDGKGGNSP